MNLYTQSIKSTVKAFPAVIPHLKGRARWIAFALAGVKGGRGSGNFNHSGRPGLVGGSAPEGTIRPSDIGDKDLEKRIKDICDKMGFPYERIYISKSITGVAGSYNTVTDEIILNPFSTGKTLEPVLTHEITHAIFQKIEDSVWESQLKEWTNEYLEVSRQDMDYDEITEYEDNYRILVQSFGGVTDYSNSFWTTETITNKTLFKIAVNETFAEIARLDSIGQGDSVPPNWRAVYEGTFGK